MTTTNDKINFGKEEETGQYFAYANDFPITDFASSEISQEDALLKLCNTLAKKLISIHKTTVS